MNPARIKSKKIPSGENCLQCISNLINLLSSGYYEDQNLSAKERVALLKQDSDKLKPVISLFIQSLDALLDKKSLLERKILEQMTQEKIIEDVCLTNEEEKSITKRKRIQIIGKISDIAQKIGKFFFNPGNKDGLKINRIHEAEIIELFSVFCESIKGTQYGSSYFMDNVNIGAIKDLVKKNKLDNSTLNNL